MILAIDVGNTNIVVGCIEEGKILFFERIATDMLKTELEYAATIKVLFELYHIERESVKGCIISSVVPPINRTLQLAVDKLFGLECMIVGPGVKTGLNILMDNPAQVGADLIVNAVAALHLYGGPLIIIDMGTATTVSVLDKNKNYIGGMIMPGVMVSLDSLVNSTSQLPKIGLDSPKKILGKNTIDGMKSGIIFSQAAAIDGIVERIWEELSYTCPVIATGGLATKIIPQCKHEITVDQELTLTGLSLIYEKNRNNHSHGTNRNSS